MPYKNPVCRGSYALGTACGKCERCQEQKHLHVAMKVETFTAVDQDRVKLCDLLDAKEKAHGTWMNYVHTNRDPLKLPERVELDIKQHLAMKASNVADRAYQDALDAFVTPAPVSAPDAGNNA